MDIFPITALPTEIRGLIFNRLPQNLVEEIRVVCKQWKNEIEKNFNFRLDLNEKNPHLGNLLERRVYSCYASKFLETPPTRTRIFKYPNVVKILETNHSGHISPENLNQLLSECGNHLRKIDLTLDTSLIKHKYEFSPKLNFNNLVNLRLSLIDSVQDVSGMSELVNKAFLPNLKSFYLYTSVSCRDERELSIFVLIFVCKHWESLERVSLCFRGSDWLITETDIKKHADLSVLRKQMGIMNRLISLTMIVYLDKRFCGFWEKFINNQKQLKLIYFSGFDYNSIIQPVLNNFESLLSVAIIGDLPQVNSTIDLSIFKTCFKLQVLAISLLGNTILVNFAQLPVSVGTFITAELIFTNDLFAYFTNPERRLTYSNFSFYNCGTTDGFGVNGSVLEKILNNFGSMRLFIKGFNLTDPEEKK